MTKLAPGTPVIMITNAQVPIEPVRTEPGTLQDWVNLSYKLMPIDRWLTPAVQKLGFLDLHLRDRDKDMDVDVEDMNDDGKITHMLNFNEWQYTSELWVLSAYEVVRYTNADLGRLAGTTVEMRQQWAALKKDYEEIRIPLAKFRPSANAADRDTDVAYPVVPGGCGAGWTLGPETVIWREELAEKLREAIRALP